MGTGGCQVRKAAVTWRLGTRSVKLERRSPKTLTAGSTGRIRAVLPARLRRGKVVVGLRVTTASGRVSSSRQFLAIGR